MTELPKIVSTRLAAPGNSEHPDADQLTAYLEGMAGGSERDQLLSHISGCAQCRQTIALALPESSAEAVSEAAARNRKSWLHMPALRWATLGACLVVVAAAVLLIQKREDLSRPEVQVAMKVAPPPAVANQTSNSTPSVAQGIVSGPELKAKSRRSPAPKRQELASTNVPATPPNAVISGNVAAAGRMQTSEAAEAQAGPANFEPTSPEEADHSLSARKSIATAKAAPLFTPRPSTETAASTIGSAAKLTDFHAPHWRLSQDGLPERSFTTGQWEKVQVDHKTGFRAITARDMDVWIGGLGGLLYHSEDVGLHWTRIIAVSSSATLTDDVTGIEFSDHMHGKVHTSSGQIWVTADAGTTWEIQQP